MTQEELQQLQALFRIGERNPITLRAIRKGQPAINLNFHATDYPKVEDRWAAFAAEAGRLNAGGYNIYTCLNPIKPEFAGSAVSDKDIACRRLLLIDLDRAGDTKLPATNDEIHAAMGVSCRIEERVTSLLGEAPTRIMSGNGIHLYLPLADLPNDIRSSAMCKAVLESLAADFDTADVKVDPLVHNASRITKVLGTVAYKGQATDERPYRKAMIL